MIDEPQPQAVSSRMADRVPSWVGNERVCRSYQLVFPSGRQVYPGYPKYRELQYGHADGNQWVAANVMFPSVRDGSIILEEDDKVKTVDQLTDLYYRSVGGHNATLLLNFPVIVTV